MRASIWSLASFSQVLLGRDDEMCSLYEQADVALWHMDAGQCGFLLAPLLSSAYKCKSATHAN